MPTLKPATPLPWSHEQHDARLCMGGCEDLHGLYHATHNGRDTVKECLAENVQPETAAYIVAACNAYPALVAALRLVVEHDGKLTGADWAQIHGVLRSLGEE